MSSELWTFVFGIFVGAFVGVLIGGLLGAASRADRMSEEWLWRHRQEGNE